MKKAQVTLEMILIIGVLLATVLVFAGIVYNSQQRTVKRVEKRTDKIIKVIDKIK